MVLIVRNLLKMGIAVIFGVFAWFMGIYLLDGFVIWKTSILVLACSSLDQIIYKILRVIDKHTE